MFLNKNEFLKNARNINCIIKRLNIILKSDGDTNNAYSYIDYEAKIKERKDPIWSNPFPMHGQNVDVGVLFRCCIVSLQIRIKGI